MCQTGIRQTVVLGKAPKWREFEGMSTRDEHIVCNRPTTPVRTRCSFWLQYLGFSSNMGVVANGGKWNDVVQRHLSIYPNQGSRQLDLVSTEVRAEKGSR